jgi:hypothetical protein
MNNEAALVLESTVIGFFSGRLPTEDELRSKVELFGKAIDADQDVRDLVVRRLETKLRVKVDVGVAISASHHPWVLQRAATIDPFFWNRYARYLETNKRWPSTVVSTLGRTTEEILDLLGNPIEPGSWKRRGLVLGDVQSGKTATYTALISKAADAGYRLVVLLTGTLENLRRQTQERMDEGFVGFDSSGELRKVREGIQVGVGLVDATRQATVFTSRSNDFSTATVQALGLRISALKEPALVVLKKNKAILRNLNAWLKDYNADASGKIDIPMLLVDDEADNASLNTSPDAATAINAEIRKLLSLFTRNSYVGFTATPFANIFVDPDKEDAMLGDDLFPRDFIYSLSAPSNYVGPTALFGDEPSPMLRTIEDGWDIFPYGHKKELKVKELPESLWTALDCFLVGNVIRDLRLEGPTHRSMLVNVTRFSDVQIDVQGLIQVRLDQIKASVRNFSKLPVKEAVRDPMIARLREAFISHFPDIEFGWERIQAGLLDSVSPVISVAVNQKRKNALDYKPHEKTGLRVVAVGGNSLSRGFTLEGLMTSYFLRTTAMYDTLLQMGRWFGYRDGYEDICRLWMTQEARIWYSHITEATQELRDEIAKMKEQGRTPEDFGLAVRAHPDALIVTAYNKMRTAKSVERVVSVSNRLFESYELATDKDVREQNHRAIKTFLAAAHRAGEWELHRKTSPFLRNVPNHVVAQLVRSFRVGPSDLLFQPEELASIIERCPDPKLAAWDVLVPAGNERRSLEVDGHRVPYQRRAVELKRRAWHVSGDKRRIASRGDEACGLGAEALALAQEASLREREEREAKTGRKADDEARLSISDKHFRAQRDRPLIMLHFIEPYLNDTAAIGADDPPLCGISISFCPFEDTGDQKRVVYRINVVKLRELIGDESDGDDDVEDAA